MQTTVPYLVHLIGNWGGGGGNVIGTQQAIRPLIRIKARHKCFQKSLPLQMDLIVTLIGLFVARAFLIG